MPRDALFATFFTQLFMLPPFSLAAIRAASPQSSQEASTPKAPQVTTTKRAVEIPTADSQEPALTHCISQIGPRPIGANSGRNNWMAKLALFCNERGVKQQPLENYGLEHCQEPDFKAEEILSIIRGVYKRKADQHNAKPYLPPHLWHKAKAQEAQAQPPMPNGAAGGSIPPAAPETPTFPSDAYDDLPDFLRRCCQPFVGREADVLLTSLLVVLSGVFPTVTGVYDGKKVGMNLYALISAPAANGKGAMVWGGRVVRVRHRYLQAASQEAFRQYQLETANFQALKRSSTQAAQAPPVEPVAKGLLIPADSSFAALVQNLADNDGRGIICETEADTLTAILGNKDWGGYSPLLRGAFHHEPYSTSRKGSGRIEIERPALSVVLTGTPQQVLRLIPDVENGLYSRFLFYLYAADPFWRDTFALRQPLDDYYERLGQELSEMIEFVQHDVIFGLTPEQEAQHTTAFCEWTDGIEASRGEQHGSLRRLGLSAFRIAMLLTVLRCFENGEQPTGHLTCSDQDFNTAMTLIRVFREHTNHLLNSMVPEGTSKANALKTEKLELARQLQAQGLSLRTIAEQTGISKSALHRQFSDFPDGYQSGSTDKVR